MADEFKVFLGDDLYCVVNKLKEYVNVSFRRFKTYAGNSKPYPTKDGVVLSMSQYGVYLRITNTILKIIDDEDFVGYGKVFEKDLGFGKAVYVFAARDFTNSYGPFTIEIRSIQLDSDKSRKIMLTQAQYRTWVKNRGEIGEEFDRMMGKAASIVNRPLDSEIEKGRNRIMNNAGSSGKMEKELIRPVVDRPRDLFLIPEKKEVDMMELEISSMGCFLL